MATAEVTVMGAATTALAAWVQAVTVTAVGALLGLVAAGPVGARVGGVVSALFAVAYALAVARGRPYEDGARGLRRWLLDCTWSGPNTWAGAIYYGVHRLFGNTIDPERCRGKGSIWLVRGIVPKYATTIGPVKAGSNDRR